MESSNLHNVKEEVNDWEAEELDNEYYKQNNHNTHQITGMDGFQGMEDGELVPENFEYEDTNGHDNNALDLDGSMSDWMNIHEKQLEDIRRKAQKQNAQPREDCPVCGDKANGLHYGIYSCEGCKNFFKRSVVLTKEYVCSNRQNCDIGIVIDMSGMKRKGARCQACRYAACLDAGMFHSGYQRSRGGRKPPSLKKLMYRQSTSPPQIVLDNEIEQVSAEPLAISFEPPASKCNGSNEQKNHLTFPSNIKMGAVFMETNKKFEANSQTSSEKAWHTTTTDSSPRKRASFDESIGNTSCSKRASFDESFGVEQRDDQTEEPIKRKNRPIPDLIKTAGDLMESTYKDDYHKEVSKNRELVFRLREKEKQLKISERQIDSMRKHMLISQSITAAQQEENTKLKEEIFRMKMFQNTVNNYGGKSQSQHQQQIYQNGSEMALENHEILEPEIGINEEEDEVLPMIKNELCKW